MSWWPFTKKKEKEPEGFKWSGWIQPVNEVDIKKLLDREPLYPGTVKIPVRMYGGRPLKANADPSALIEKLKTNRSNMGTGSGQAYWESVVRVVEDHYGIK